MLKEAIAKYGIDAQLNVVVEEMSELIKEICKFKRGSVNTPHIIEETADCFIMLQQMVLMFQIAPEELHKAIEDKILRLKSRMEA